MIDPIDAVAAQLPVGATVPDMPEVVDHVAVARLYGEPLFSLPTDLYIPPDALEVFLEAFEGPLDLLLYLIRKQNFNILDIPMAGVTRQYLSYVEEIRTRNLELAAEYLLMAAMLIEIKSRMLLPPRKIAEGQEPEDPRAALVRRAGSETEGGVAFLTAATSVAASLNCDVVAEGVETDAQRQFLLQAGCDQLQGLGISAPLTAAALEAWLGSHPQASPSAVPDQRTSPCA